jgi:hypothetical protein
MCNPSGNKIDMRAYPSMRLLCLPDLLQQVAKVSIEKALQAKSSSNCFWPMRVRTLQLAYVFKTIIWIFNVLYPIYLGYYNCEGEKLLNQIDVIRGKMWADLPNPVKSKART